MRKQPRKAGSSYSYQHIFKEIGVDRKSLEQYTSDQNIGNWAVVNEEISHLKSSLIEEIMKLKEKLTKRQQEIISLYLDGLTQNEIAQRLGIQQSVISKALYGCVYSFSRNKKYGGIIKKLKKLASNSAEIKEILRQIKELKYEGD